MKENIDIALTTSKMATRNNPWAHLATQAFSMGYNASMLWYYNYQLAMAQAMGVGYMSAEQIQSYKQERIKHSFLLGVECAALIVASLGTMCETRRRLVSESIR